MRICVIIPTYNESLAIANLIHQITKLGLEVIIIDDGSADDTVSIATASGAKVLTNQKNMGKGASLIKGYNFALEHGFDAVISMDGDGQHSCADLPAFIRKAQSFGITLSEIKEIIRQSERGLESCCNHVGKLFRRKLKEFEIKMKELQRMRRGLKNMMKQWIPLEQAKKRHYAVCPQIETERPKRKRGKRHGKKKS